jgi:predicted HTH transcriptional regulator
MIVCSVRFRRFGLSEHLGKGVDHMQDDMAAELLDAPEFSQNGSFSG